MYCRAPFLAALLLLLVAGSNALPASSLGGLRARRALRATAAESPAPAPAEFPIETILWDNACSETGVTFGARFQFDPDWSWFEPPTTDYIPRPFVDYFCDNIGEVNFQFGDDTNKMNDPKVQAAIATGVCYNEWVMLRSPGYRGHGPQPTLDLEYPNGTVYDMHVTLRAQDGEARPGVKLASYEEEVWRTDSADFLPCEEGEKGCTRWYKVSLDQPIEFVCDEEQAGARRLSR